MPVTRLFLPLTSLVMLCLLAVTALVYAFDGDPDADLLVYVETSSERVILHDVDRKFDHRVPFADNRQRYADEAADDGGLILHSAQNENLHCTLFRTGEPQVGRYISLTNSESCRVAVSRNMAYLASVGPIDGDGTDWEVSVFDISGDPETRISVRYNWGRTPLPYINISPDGNHVLLLFERYSQDAFDILHINAVTQAVREVNDNRWFLSIFGTSNHWSANSRYFVFALAASTDTSRLWLFDTATGTLEQLTDDPVLSPPINPSPSGRYFFYVTHNSEEPRYLPQVLDTEDGTVYILTDAPTPDRWSRADWSPDGAYAAFHVQSGDEEARLIYDTSTWTLIHEIRGLDIRSWPNWYALRSDLFLDLNVLTGERQLLRIDPATGETRAYPGGFTPSPDPNVPWAAGVPPEDIPVLEFMHLETEEIVTVALPERAITSPLWLASHRHVMLLGDDAFYVVAVEDGRWTAISQPNVTPLEVGRDTYSFPFYAGDDVWRLHLDTYELEHVVSGARDPFFLP